MNDLRNKPSTPLRQKGSIFNFLKGIYESHIGRIDLMDVFKPLQYDQPQKKQLALPL